jgi:hypothetical protein
MLCLVQPKELALSFSVILLFVSIIYSLSVFSSAVYFYLYLFFIHLSFPSEGMVLKSCENGNDRRRTMVLHGCAKMYAFAFLANAMRNNNDNGDAFACFSCFRSQDHRRWATMFLLRHRAVVGCIVHFALVKVGKRSGNGLGSLLGAFSTYLRVSPWR